MQWLRKDDNHHRLSFLWAGTRGGAGDRAGMSCPCSVTPGAGTILRAFHAHVELPAPASVRAGGSWRPRWTVGRNTPTWPLHVAWAPARHGGEVRTEPGRSLLPRRTWPPKPCTVAATKITDPTGLKGRKRRPARAWGASAASRVPGRVCRASEVGVRAPLRTANAPELQTVPSTKASACTRAGGRRRDSLPGDGFPSRDVDRGAAQAVTHSHRLCFPRETLPAGWRIPRRWTPRLASSKSQRHGDLCPQNPQISPAGGAQLARPGMAVNRELIHCVILPPGLGAIFAWRGKKEPAFQISRF